MPMDKLTFICGTLERQLGTTSYLQESPLYIDRIFKCSGKYYIFTSDKFGNNTSLAVSCFDEVTGKELNYTNKIATGVFCDVPTRYRSYRARLIDELYQDSEIQELGLISKWEMFIPLNTLYLVEEFKEISYNDLYTIAKFFIKLVHKYCTADQRKRYQALMEVPRISFFLDLTLDDKILRASYDYLNQTT
jgi:hypothetical protein